jgi:hypothetical protein
MSPDSPYRNQAPAPRPARHSVVDREHGGMVVATFAHPAEWRARSQVIWNTQHTSLPALVYATTFNPSGAEVFEFLPTQAFFWLDNDYGTVPVGQNAHGLVRMPPTPPPDALVNLVIPAFRRDRQNLRVAFVRLVQNLWQFFNDPPPQNGQGVMARVEYEENGRAIEEEFYGVYDWNQTSGGTVMQTNWGFGRLACFRAERGRLDAARETFWRIAGSLQLNPQWRQVYDQVVQQLMAGFNVRIGSINDRLRAEQEQGRRNIEYNDHLIAERGARVNESVERQRQLNHERSQSGYSNNDEFGDMLMNRTAYQDPNSSVGNYHYEQGSPEYVWTDGQGSFYSTNDPTDNPNQHRNGNWVPAQRVERNR